MFAFPQRTSEFESGSTSTAPRKSSRLPTANRSNTLSQIESNELSVSASPNGHILKRLKRSVSSGTPTITTPLRRISSRSSDFPTPNDRKDKAARIVETLRVHFGKDYLPQGLRSMSSKLFISTMAYFMKTVLGNSRGNRLDAEKLTVDDITKYLIEVGYSVNKPSMSWMKTPNAPHALCSLVDLLQWLCMFLPSDAKVHPFEESDNLADIDKCFPNIEYAQIFLSSIKENFPLWNNQQKEEYENSKAQLIDKYINIHTGGSIRTKDQIEIEITRNKREYNEQLKTRFSGPTQKKLEDLMATEQQMQADIKQLLALCDVQTSKRNEIQSQLHQQELIVKELNEQVFELQKTIARQPCTQANLELQIATLTKNRQLLDVHKNTQNQLKGMGLANQIKLARTLTQQNEVAQSFNNMVHEKFLALGDTSWQSFDVTDLIINMNEMTDLRSQIDRIFRNFDLIRQRNNTASDNIREKLVYLEARLQSAKANHTVEMVHYEDLMKNFAKLEGDLMEVESEVKCARQLRQSAVDNIKQETDRLMLSIDAKSSTVSIMEVQLVHMPDDNMVIVKDYERMGEQQIQVKRDRLERTLIALNDIQHSFQMLKAEMEQQK